MKILQGVRLTLREYGLKFARDGSAMLLILAILAGGYWFTVSQTIKYQGDILWNPNIFAGMPSFAVGSNGADWHNLIILIWTAIINYSFHNPIMFIIFAGLTYRLYLRYTESKPVLVSYICVILVEIFMVLTTTL